jgi:hypothetical protein
MAVGTAAVAIAVSLGPNGRQTGSRGFAEAPVLQPGDPPLAGFAQAPLEADVAWEVSELNVRAPMPEPVEQYLQQVGRQPVGQELRLDTGNRLRGSDYFYPVRRLEVGGGMRVGTPVGQSFVRPVSPDPRPAVIAF